MKSIIIIGNAEPKKNYSVIIDNADIVVRFNNARNFQSGLVGEKTDVLCIANTGDPGRKFAKYRRIRKLSFIDNVTEVWFPFFSNHLAAQFWFKPFDKNIFNKMDYYYWIIKRNDLTKKQIIHFGLHQNLSAFNELNLENQKFRPSSGYLVTKYIIEKYSQDNFCITLIGFSFSGSTHHNWKEEEKNFLQLHKNGIITIL